MNRLQHAFMSPPHCLMVCVVALTVAAAMPGQYLTEAFSVPMPAPGGGLVYVPIAADFNQNGYADLLYLITPSLFFWVDLDPAVSGAGPDFQQTYSTAGWGNNMHAAAADVNSDGLLDLVYDQQDSLTVPGTSVTTIKINIGNGNGTFVPASAPGITMSPPGSPLYWFAMTDVNNDGFPDILAVSAGTNMVPTISCYINQFPVWNLSWQALAYPTGGVNVFGAGGSPRAGDFDGDGNSDLAIQHTDFGVSWTTNILWGNGAGQFTAPSNVQISGFPVLPVLADTGFMGAADMDGDGTTDLVSSVPTTVGGAATELLQVYLGSAARTLIPAGTFTAPPTAPLPVATVVGDFNRDGFGDLLRGPKPNLSAFPAACNFGVTMALGLPGGQLHQAGMNTMHTPCSTSAYCPYTVVADFDGDSDLDLVCTPYYCPFYYFRNSSVTGAGCSGSGLATPGLLPGSAVLGNAGFSATLYAALSNSPATLAIGTALSASPINTCGVYLDLAGPAVFLPGVTNANGNVVWPLPIPNLPALHGATFHAQAAVLDSLGPNLGGLNLALTPARTVIVW